MKGQLQRFSLLLWVFLIPFQIALSQDRISKNNYTGDWGTPTTWNPTWPVPLSNISNSNVTIYGYITANTSLSFSGFGNLIVEDTLVIKGNLSINDACNVIVKDNGILIVRGNVTISNSTNVTANGYFIITGNFNKSGEVEQGSFTSNDNPARVFIGGNVHPPGLKDNKPNLPVLNCTPPLSGYPISNCSYGNMDDLMNDPVYDFFLLTCATVSLTSSEAGNSFCAGTSVTFTAGGGTNYNFRINGTSVQNGISNLYTTTTLTNGSIVDVIVTGSGGCTVTSSGITNTVLVLPTPSFTVQPGAAACAATNVTYTTQAGQSSYVWTFTGVSGTDYSIISGGTGTSNTVTLRWITSGSKTVSINYTNAGGCTAAAATSSTATNVTLLPTPTFTVQPGATACAATNVTYTTQTGQTSYVWTFSGVSGIDYNIISGGTGTSNTVTLRWLTAGSKTVSINYTNANGCTAAAATTSTATVVTLLPTPSFTVQPGAAACAVTDVTYTTQAGQTSYVWTFTGVSGTDYSIISGGTPTSNTVTLRWLTAGSKTVSINYTNAGGCTAAAATSSTATNVTLLPTPSFTVQPGAAACAVTDVTYTTQAGQTGYVWTFTGVLSTDYSITSGGTGTSNTVTLRWLTSGNKTVSINYTNAGGCTAAAAATSNVFIYSIPVANAGVDQELCNVNNTRLAGNNPTTIQPTATGQWTLISGPNEPVFANDALFNSTVTGMIAGKYIFRWTVSNGTCSNASDEVRVINFVPPYAYAGTDKEITFIYETHMEAELLPGETGTWSVISGSGHFDDINSPTTRVIKLSMGENIFLWKVNNEFCENADDVKIKVNDLFIPTVITPNGDGVNDYFIIDDYNGRLELIVLNRWGNEEFRSIDYKNDWDGRNHRGAILPSDTYFYILKIENGKVRKGSVLIKR